MAVFLAVLATLCLAVGAAPPAPPRLDTDSPAHLPQINQYWPNLNLSPKLDFWPKLGRNQKFGRTLYYMDNQDVASYNTEGQQKQGNANNESNGSPLRLETLDPNSEVELIPGAQLPQQPPQQTPVAPNFPGLLPGQNVFVVRMPIPGYGHGIVGGYQPVYIVTAAPEGYDYTRNGYQYPSGQAVYPQILGYPHSGLGFAQGNPNFLIGGTPLVYQEPVVAYQPAQGVQSSGESVQETHSEKEPRPANEAQANPESMKANLESSAA